MSWNIVTISVAEVKTKWNLIVTFFKHAYNKTLILTWYILDNFFSILSSAHLQCQSISIYTSKQRDTPIGVLIKSNLIPKMGDYSSFYAHFFYPFMHYYPAYHWSTLVWNLDVCPCTHKAIPGTAPWTRALWKYTLLFVVFFPILEKSSSVPIQLIPQPLQTALPAKVGGQHRSLKANLSGRNEGH